MAQVGDFATQQLADAQHGGLAVQLVDQAVATQPQAGAGRIAEHGLEGAVGIDGAIVATDQDHADGGALHDLAQQRFALLEAEHICSQHMVVQVVHRQSLVQDN